MIKTSSLNTACAWIEKHGSQLSRGHARNSDSFFARSCLFHLQLARSPHAQFERHFRPSSVARYALVVRSCMLTHSPFTPLCVCANLPFVHIAISHGSSVVAIKSRNRAQFIARASRCMVL